MSVQRPRSPELEHELARSPQLGYEPHGTFGSIRCFEHGFPNPLVRWHHHDEYELHLIVATRGKVFVGDYIGHFEPGHLVLTGPRLPHNWISTGTPPEGVARRDIVIQFPDAPLRQGAACVPELRETWALLERSRCGVEFFGMSQEVLERYHRMKECQGLRRFGLFLELLGALTRCDDYRLLSSVQLQCAEDDFTLGRIECIVDYINERFSEPLSLPDVSARFGMTANQFSRFFKRATGNSFTYFVNRLRVTKACQLLMETDRYVSTVCYDVGFNNVANFNRRFLQIKGVTPKEFRRQAGARFGPPEPLATGTAAPGDPVEHEAPSWPPSNGAAAVSASDR